MLASLNLMGLRDIHRMNGLKTVLSTVINIIAFAYFSLPGPGRVAPGGADVGWNIAGGYLGAHWAMRVDQHKIRSFVTAIGLVVSLWLFLK